MIRIEKLIIILFAFIGLILNNSCHNTQQNLKDKPIKVILDTDMGSDCDDAGAMALLHAYADLGKVDIIGIIYSSGKVPYGAGVIDAINRYYYRPDIPIGAYYGNDIGDSIDKMSAEKLVKDTSAYHNKIIHNTDAEEQTRLNRKLLSAQGDNSIVYITIGHTKGLHDLLVSKADDISSLNGFELVSKKVNRWVALGALGANNKNLNYTKDWNFFFNGTAMYTKYLVENFPSPIYFINGGSDVMTGKSLKTTPPGNIIRTAYRDWLWNYEKSTLDDQRPSWDLVTIYFAVEGLGEYFDVEESGWLEFDLDKGCKWIRDEKESKQYYITQKEGTSQKFANYLNEMIAKIPNTKKENN